MIPGISGLISGAAAHDPYWSSVELLLGFNAVPFTDESTRGRTVTTNGAVTATTSSPLVGAASASFPGTDSAYLSLINSGAFSLGGGDRTFEARINLTSLASSRYIFSKRPAGGTNEWVMWVSTAGALQLAAWNVDTTPVLSFASANGLISAGTTYEVAASRVAATGTTYLAINGTVVASAVETAAPSVVSSLFLIGRELTAAGRDFAGKIDEVRVTSAARFTADYAPTSGAYPRG